MEKFYTKEFILAFLYNELPFSLKREFVERLHEDPSLKKVFLELKKAKESLKSMKLCSPPDKLVNYIRSYAASFEENNFLSISKN